MLTSNLLALVTIFKVRYVRRYIVAAAAAAAALPSRSGQTTCPICAADLKRVSYWRHLTGLVGIVQVCNMSQFF